MKSNRNLNIFSTSIVIRALNEARHIGKLLYGLKQQTKLPDEIILVDSGSTDDTLMIASSYDVKIVKIKKNEFSFGKALNIGCEEASKEILIFVSAHVYPSDKNWLQNLIKPFIDSKVVCSYGKQRGDRKTKYSENQIFNSWFPEDINDIKTKYFCNNANCAIRKSVWNEYQYDENLTGLEDLDWAKNQYSLGYKIIYSPKAKVIHVHNENWKQIRNRYRREAIALRRIEPTMTLNLFNLVYLLFLSILCDSLSTKSTKIFYLNFYSIILFRFNQYLGTYLGLNSKSMDISHLRSTFYFPSMKIKSESKRRLKLNSLSNNNESSDLINYDIF